MAKVKPDQSVYIYGAGSIDGVHKERWVSALNLRRPEQPVSAKEQFTS